MTPKLPRLGSQLLQEQRVALGSGDQPFRPLQIWTYQRCRKFSRLLGAERPDRDRDRALQSPAPRLPDVEEIQPRRAQEHDRSSRPASGVFDQIDQAGTRILQIVQNGDDRVSSSEGLEEPTDGPGGLRRALSPHAEERAQGRLESRRVRPAMDQLSQPVGRLL